MDEVVEEVMMVEESRRMRWVVVVEGVDEVEDAGVSTKTGHSCLWWS